MIDRALVVVVVLVPRRADPPEVNWSRDSSCRPSAAATPSESRFAEAVASRCRISSGRKRRRRRGNAGGGIRRVRGERMEQSENAAVSPDPENGGEGGHGYRSILPESAGKQLSFGDLGVRPRLDTNGYRQPASLLPGGGGGFHSSAETFHVRGREPRVGADDSGSCCFAGRRDVLSPTSMLETRIVSDRGTVRGFRNRVRAGIVTFFENPEDDHINFRNLEKDKIVIYITSMGVIRETYENCKRVQKILQTHMVRYEEKDLFMSVENQKDLRRRLVGQKKTCIPQVFIDGVLLGGVEELEILNENGELRKILDNFVKISVKSSCNKCGGYRFIPCSACHGSKRSAYRNHFTEEFCELRCIHCNDHGLIRCDMCLDQQE